MGARARREQPALRAGRKAALERAGGRCETCGVGSRSLDVHHVIRRSRAPGWVGLHAAENLKALCRACHDAIHSGYA
jgi:5-methylcytosine-specific restriction endonuclease McrA